jgi:hypothetical protein
MNGSRPFCDFPIADAPEPGRKHADLQEIRKAATAAMSRLQEASTQ